MKKFEDLSVAFADLSKKFEDTKAAGPDEMNSKMDNLHYMCQNLASQMRWLHQDMQDQRTAHASHINGGHLPPIKSPSQMSKAIEVLGLSNDYEVQKHPIYVHASKRGQIVVAAFQKSKDD